MGKVGRRGFVAGAALGMVSLAATAAVAAPPWKRDIPGGGPGHGGKPAGPGDEHGRGPDFHHSQADQDRIRGYYAEEFRRGRCPPGLARKNNGCLPPGQAKAWTLGQRLPPGVAYYPLPGVLLAQIAVPPPGYQYVRVASDVLMIAVASGVIVSAVTDLAR